MIPQPHDARIVELFRQGALLGDIAKEVGVAVTTVKRALRRSGIEVNGRTRLATLREPQPCGWDACERVAKAKGLCMKHYARKYGYVRSTTRDKHAEMQLRRGIAPNPPLSLPYRALATSCLRCGDLITVPARLLRKANGPAPKCVPCRSEVARERRERRGDEYLAEVLQRYKGVQAETLPTATRRGQQWTGPELELIARPDLTAEQAAKMLGRTFAAVRRQRQVLEKDPRKQHLAGLGRP